MPRTAREKENKNHRQRSRQQWLNGLKAGLCSDCHRLFPPICMDFDHVRGEKLFGLAGGNGVGRSIQSVEAEIAKCDLVCSNCHRIRTQMRRRKY